MGLRFFGRLREDLRSWDRHNEDEEKVIRSHYFSCYKGVPVFRTGMRRSGCFGAIFLKRKLPIDIAADEVRHEYGHRLQMKELGVVAYFFRIFRPSAKTVSDGTYYEKPWEITADVLGKVRSRPHAREDIVRGFIYLNEKRR